MSPHHDINMTHRSPDNVLLKKAIHRRQAKISQKLQAPFKPPQLPKEDPLRSPPKEDMDHKVNPEQDQQKKD